MIKETFWTMFKRKMEEVELEIKSTNNSLECFAIKKRRKNRPIAR